jgi:hypothetical protein
MKVTKLRGDEIPVTDEMRARVFWLMQRFSSYTHIKRCIDVLSTFTKGYEGYALADKRRDNGGWHRENLAKLFASRLSLTTGLNQVKKGQTSGYRDVRKGASFVGYFQSPRFGSWAPPFLEEIGFRDRPDLSVGLWAWLELAIGFGEQIQASIMARGVFPGILTVVPYRYPPNLPRMPKRLGVKVPYTKEFPLSGIWMPTSFPNGCPAYLCAGDFAPAAERLAQRIDRPPMKAGKWTPAEPAQTSYMYELTETDWELLWEDHRYRGGVIPDESAYLDETTEDPPYPPRYEPAKHLEVQ